MSNGDIIPIKQEPKTLDDIKEGRKALEEELLILIQAFELEYNVGTNIEITTGHQLKTGPTQPVTFHVQVDVIA